jgi:hypothetical protein
MVNDAINHALRPGMSERDIVGLLGHPEKTWPGRESTPPEHDVWEYDLGYAPNDWAGQHNVLRLSFDTAGHYASYEHTRD